MLLFINRLRGASWQKSGVIPVTESHTSEVSVTTFAHVHGKAGNDSDSSTEHTVEDEQKVKGHVIMQCLFLLAKIETFKILYPVITDCSTKHYIRFEVFKVVTMKNTVFWDIDVAVVN
jgi:hypothetical protein